MNAKLYRLLGAIAVGAMLALSGGGAVLARDQASAAVVPAEGVPGVAFTFTADGFKGAVPAEDASEGKGEEVAYWVNLPDGRVISTEPRSGKNDRGNDTKPLLTRADGYGAVRFRWTSPENAIEGRYTLVMQGKESGRQIVIPFMMHADGWQTEVQTNVTPKAGPAGTEFLFIATGYEGAGVDADAAGSHGEKVAYWINMPDGHVIATEQLGDTDDYGNDTRPLLHFADGHGVVSIYWIAPAELAPGAYSITIHGLNSHREVMIPFTIS